MSNLKVYKRKYFTDMFGRQKKIRNRGRQKNNSTNRKRIT